LHRLTELLRKAGGKWGLSLFLAAAAALAQGNEPAAVDPGSPGSAYGTAKLLLNHLAAGDIEAAARLSNAPQQRYELLRDYRARSARRSSSACSAGTSTRKTGWSPNTGLAFTAC